MATSMIDMACGGWHEYFLYATFPLRTRKQFVCAVQARSEEVRIIGKEPPAKTDTACVLMECLQESVVH